jgi:prefoldin alpha subunit
MKNNTKEHEHEHNHLQDNEQKIMELNMLDSRMKQLEQSINFIDQQIMEQQLTQMSIDEIKKMKNGGEMLLPIGKNVFIKGKIEEHEILVNVGNNIFLRRDEEKAKETIGRQKLQISAIRDEIAREMEKIANQISLIEHSLH